MDTRMLDVAIGLALLFALASLLATACQELFASVRNTRGGINREAIASMVGTQSGLLDLIYAHPLIQSLHRTEKRAPSFIPSDVFSTVLLHVLAEGRGTTPRQGTPMEFLNAISQGGGGALTAGSAGLLTVLNTLSMGAENDWAAFEQRIQAWYDHTGGRSLGWFKRDTSLTLFVIGLILASVMNLDAVTIGRTLWDDPAARQRVVEVARTVASAREGASAPLHAEAASSQVSAAGQPSEPSRKPAAGAATQARPDPSPMALSLASALKSELEADVARASSAQDKATRYQRWLLMSRLTEAHRTEGLVRREAPDTPAGRDTLREAQKASDQQAQMLLDSLPTEDAGRSATDRDSAASIRARAEVVIKALRAERQTLLPSEAAASAPPAASAPHAGPANLCKRLSAGLQDTCLATCKDLVGAQADVCQSTYALQAVHDAGIPMGWTDAALANVYPTPKWPSLIQMLFGWLLTAIAVTLGAPFWFDTLSKLVKIRGSGSTAADAKSGSAPNLTASTEPASPPAAASGAADGFSDALNDAEKALTADQVSSIQMQLGMGNAQITGRLDFPTRDAIKAWQQDQHLPVSGLLSTHEIQLLLTRRAVAPAANPAQAPGAATAPGNDVYEG